VSIPFESEHYLLCRPLRQSVCSGKKKESSRPAGLALQRAVGFDARVVMMVYFVVRSSVAHRPAELRARDSLVFDRVDDQAPVVGT
jgi:hypothetical protein